MRIASDQVKHVTSIGAGPIGAGWAAHFLARGYDVTAYLHDRNEEDKFMSVVNTAWPCLIDLGLANGASMDRLTITDDLAKATKDAQFIQESAPERLPIKQDLYETLGRITAPDVVIASSTSGLPMTDIQATCSTPERCVVGHPFNPPYLLPLVEVIGGNKTTDDALDWAMDFYATAGKEPVRLKKEIPGFIATRLQKPYGAKRYTWLLMAKQHPKILIGHCALGLPRAWLFKASAWRFMWLAAQGGMATNLDQFGPALKLPWTRLEAPELTQELRDAMVDGCNAMTEGKDFEDMAADRDRRIVAILKAANDPL
jgi:carnitine 3-dehydrogenase